MFLPLISLSRHCVLEPGIFVVNLYYSISVVLSVDFLGLIQTNLWWEREKIISVTKLDYHLMKCKRKHECYTMWLFKYLILSSDHNYIKNSD